MNKRNNIIGLLVLLAVGVFTITYNVSLAEQYNAALARQVETTDHEVDRVIPTGVVIAKVDSVIVQKKVMAKKPVIQRMVSEGIAWERKTVSKLLPTLPGSKVKGYLPGPNEGSWKRDIRKMFDHRNVQGPRFLEGGLQKR